MIQIFATSTQVNLLIYLGGGGFVLLGSFFFGRLVTFFFPQNPLIRQGKKGKNQLNMRQVDIKKVCEYACEDADIIWQLKQLFSDKLKGTHLEKLFHTYLM